MSRGNESVAHPLFLTHARNVTHSSGQQPGFPFQFQYNQSQKSYDPTKANKEYNVPYINTDVGVDQIRRDGSMVGKYQAMVPDLPYNPPYESNIALTKAALGVGLIALGSSFYFL